MLLDNYKKESPIIGVAGMGGGINSYIFLSSGGGDVISKSLRFNSGDSSHLNRTPSSAGNQKTWTWSGWVKRSTLGTGSGGRNVLFDSTVGWTGSGDTTYGLLNFAPDNQLGFGVASTGTYTTAKFRDTSAWYHVVAAMDTTQASAADRLKLYVNGVQYTHSGYTFIQNTDYAINSATEHAIGMEERTDAAKFDGYLADVHFVDGQQLAPTEFGETDDDGVWQPKKYSGTYGTNGFHLDFKDTDAIGNDAAGSNNWTANNITTAVYGLATANQGMDVLTYTGNGGTQSITGLAFQPDFVWYKNRSTNSHKIFDSVRGATKVIYSNYNGAEETISTSLTAFTSNGFNVGSDAGSNTNSNNYVAWCWKAGGTASSNTNGSTTTQVSVNQSYGFSISTWTSPSSADTDGWTLGHGLSSAPKFMLVKNRSGAGNWTVYHASLGNTKALYLNETSTGQTNQSLWNNTDPTSTVWSAGSTGWYGTSNNFVTYAWSEVAGFSKFGSWTGNGSSTGPTITTGFKPRFLLWKRSDGTANWYIYDTARQAGNPLNKNLEPNTGDAENTLTSMNIDFLPNGFQLKGTDGDMNGNGSTYIYAAYASKPDQSTIDSLSDSPAQVANQTDSGVGGEITGNYCTLNALENNGITLSNGNLDVARSTNSWASSKGTIGVPSGKYYFEYTVNSGSSYQAIGIHKTDVAMPGVSGTGYIHVTSAAWVYQTDGNLGHANSFTNTGVTSSSGDVVMIALDVDAGKVWFGKNGTWFSSGNPATGANPSYSNITGTISPATSIYGTQTGSFNFGQRAFAHAAPSGYKCLNTANLTATIADGSEYLDTNIWDGNGTSRNITTTLSPDFVWIKGRSHATNNMIYDAVRGPTKVIYADTNSDEATQSTQLTAFNSDSFTIATANDVNYSGRTYVGYAWDAGSSTVTNTDGTITSQVRANQTSGFSIVTYTGGGANGSTIGHGLNKKPELIFLKSRTAAENWFVNHPVGTGNGYLMLNQINAGDGSNATVWNSTAPTSSVFTIGSSSGVNGSQNYVAYCFSPISGYSAMGSFSGAGSSGPFIYTGMRPSWILIKRTDNTGNWVIWDTTRQDYNALTKQIFANTSGAEQDISADAIDALSNGFMVRSSSAFGGGTFLYMAFAEHPFKSSRAR